MEKISLFRDVKALKVLSFSNTQRFYMSVTTFQCTVENGQIQLPRDVQLPEKAIVYVVVPDVKTPSSFYVGSPRLADPKQANDFVKEVSEELS